MFDKAQKEEGFIMVMLVVFVSLMILAFSGLFLTGLGIRNFTKAQTACFKINLEGQRNLGRLLEKLLHFNKKSKSLNRRKKALKWAKALALATGNMPVYLALNKSLKVVKHRQKILATRQRGLILKSRKVKFRTLKSLKSALSPLKAKHIRENTVFKKALAVKRENIGSGAYVYKPVKNFSAKQSTVFFWNMNVLQGAEGIISLGGFSGALGKYSCAATLERNGNKWKARLTK